MRNATPTPIATDRADDCRGLSTVRVPRTGRRASGSADGTGGEVDVLVSTVFVAVTSRARIHRSVSFNNAAIASGYLSALASMTNDDFGWTSSR